MKLLAFVSVCTALPSFPQAHEFPLSSLHGAGAQVAEKLLLLPHAKYEDLQDPKMDGKNRLWRAGVEEYEKVQVESNAPKKGLLVRLMELGSHHEAWDWFSSPA